MFISQKPLNNSDCFFKQRLHAHARAFVIRRYVNAQLISETTSSRRTVTTPATMTQKTFERVIAIITKPSHLRRRHEIETVLPWLRKKSSLLQHADDSEWASFLMRTKTHPVKLLETVHDNYEQRGTLWTSASWARSWSIRRVIACRRADQSGCGLRLRATTTWWRRHSAGRPGRQVSYDVYMSVHVHVHVYRYLNLRLYSISWLPKNLYS